MLLKSFVSEGLNKEKAPVSRGSKKLLIYKDTEHLFKYMKFIKTKAPELVRGKPLFTM